MYDFVMVFNCGVMLKGVNSLMHSFGFQENAMIENAGKIKIHLQLPFVPNENLIKDYETILKKVLTEKSDKLDFLEVTFQGYESFKKIENPA